MAELEELEQEDFNENILNIPTGQLPDVPSNPLPSKPRKGLLQLWRNCLSRFSLPCAVLTRISKQRVEIHVILLSLLREALYGRGVAKSSKYLCVSESAKVLESPGAAY